MKFSIYLIPLFVLTCCTGFLIFEILTSNVLFMDKHYFGMILLLINLLIWIFKSEWLKYSMLFMLVLGSLNVIGFTASLAYTNFGFSIGALHAEFYFQWFSIWMLLLWSVCFVIDKYVISPKSDSLSSIP